jgi:3-oxoacyl-[acyl-carrier-protein] synthase III
MALITYSNCSIEAIYASVPKNTIINKNYTDFFDSATAAEIVEKTGIDERRFAPDFMCASDLCLDAAQRLIEENNIQKSEIGLLIFISQTPDYRMPATSVILQQKLGLSTSTAAFDVNLGCSAFVYGLSIAFGMMQSGHIKYALVLDGETRSRVYSAKDRKTAFLFGDAGVAALIKYIPEAPQSYFSLNSDGARENYIKMDAGGYRNPSTSETLKEKVVDEFGNIRSDEHGYMNGNDVFNFLLSEIPKDIKRTLDFSGNSVDDINYFIFHQANAFMNGYLQKKLKLASENVPTCIHKYGNTSSVSIPLTIAHHFEGQKLTADKVLLSGFGVGMSWASAVLALHNCKIGTISEI